TMTAYLVYLIAGLVLVYLILEFTGFLEELGERQARKKQGQSGQEKPGLDKDLERRLQVFEDYLKDANDTPDE
ncbi:MAG: hypothetical protein R3191_07630, partial [Anaerolineales bacterium]|nr:hypothetical protein [Anaerolineales bacterium]